MKLLSNWSTRKKNIVSYYEPAKHREVVDFAYTPECWQLGLSELKKLYESGKLKRIAQQKRILDPDAFLDLAKKGFYSFSTKPFENLLANVVEPVKRTIPSSDFNSIESYSLIEHDGEEFRERQKIEIHFGENRIKSPQECMKRLDFLSIHRYVNLKVQWDGKSSGSPEIPQSKDGISYEITNYSTDFHESDGDAWVLGPVLLHQHIVNVNTHGDPTTYQILPVKRDN
ncbi:hypothetical protein ABG067_006291 [Albugo candida]